MSRFALAALVMMLAAGCAGGLHSDNPPPQVYILRAISSVSDNANTDGGNLLPGNGAPAAKRAVAAPSLQLPRPSADPGLGSERIMLVRSDHRLDYYLGNRWAADLPDVVESLAIDTLRASGAWGAVHETPSPFFADYVLQINIRRFEADYTASTNGVPRVNVVLDCTVAHRRGRDVITTFVAEAAVQASENRLAAVVAAFEQAANQALAIVAKRTAELARSPG